MTRITAFAHALADATRWRIFQLVTDGPLCVCELADILQMPQSSVSSHLQVIKKAGLLDSERCEKWIYYRLPPAYGPLLRTIGGFFEATPADTALLKADAARAGERLAARAESCCPLPRELTTVISPATKTAGGLPSPFPPGIQIKARSGSKSKSKYKLPTPSKP